MYLIQLIILDADILPEPLKTILAYITIIGIILGALDIATNLFSKGKKGKARLYNKISKWYKHKSLEKKAIASDIEDIVNESVFHLLKELPNGWIRRTTIEWVRNEKHENLKEGESILRLQPKESQDSNLIRGIYFFFTKRLFPETKEIIPETSAKSVSIQLTRRTINDYKPYLSKRFEDEVIEKEIKDNSKILEYIEDFEKLDNRGFFTGAFIREIDYTAKLLQFSRMRIDFEKEIIAIKKHMLEFMNALPKDAPDHLWKRIGSTHTYRFLLARNPYKFKYKIYVNRAIQAYDGNVDRLYVLGANPDIKFVRNVIKHIKNSTKYKLSEVYDLNRDFRKRRNGIGALFVKENESQIK